MHSELIDLGSAVREESAFEGSSFEATGEASFAVVFHICGNTNGIITVYITLLHDLIRRTDNLEDAFSTNETK